MASELILPTVRTRQCRVPTINACDGYISHQGLMIRLFWGRETALPCPPLAGI